MHRRADLQSILETAPGSPYVYFQPPPSICIYYPAIIYSRNHIDIIHANNNPYILDPGYSVTVVDKDPDSKIVEYVAKLPKCKFDRHYTADNLNHDVFTIYI